MHSSLVVCDATAYANPQICVDRLLGMSFILFLFNLCLNDQFYSILICLLKCPKKHFDPVLVFRKLGYDQNNTIFSLQ